jgi:glycosyltransferase involved in cell wall biosynthesis
MSLAPEIDRSQESTTVATASVLASSRSVAAENGLPPEIPKFSRVIRALHVINGERYSGAERVQDLLGLNLPDYGVEVTYVCLKPDQFPANRRARLSTLLSYPMAHRLDVRPVYYLAREIRAGRYDIVHAHTPRTALIAGLATLGLGIPIVYHVHSPVSRDSTRRIQNAINLVSEKLAIRDATRLIAVSRSLKTYMEEQGFPGERIRVVPNGVPGPVSYTPRPLPKKTWTVGAVALFRPRKGLEVLLQSIAKLRGAGADVALRAVGPFETPEYEATIRELIDELKIDSAVTFTGFCRDVPAELAKIDLFVLPSLFGEGMPMVLLEAMAAGVPCIASDVEGVTEVIRDGVDGLIVPPGDVDGMTVAIGEFLTGERDAAAFGAAGFERWRSGFSDKAMAAGVARVYHDLLSERGEA